MTSELVATGEPNSHVVTASAEMTSREQPGAPNALRSPPGLNRLKVNICALITAPAGILVVVKVSSEPSLGLDADSVRFGLPQPAPKDTLCARTEAIKNTAPAIANALKKTLGLNMSIRTPVELKKTTTQI